jgi:predicted permease
MSDPGQRREWLGDLLDDVRHALRQLLGAPAFAIVAIGTLGIGIGGTTAIFSAVRAVVLRPWPWAHPDRTMIVSERWRGFEGDSPTAGNFTDWRAMTSSFEALAAQELRSFALGDGETPERVLAARVSQDFFAVFGIAPLKGRLFRPEEDTPGNDGVVILGEDLWRRRYGGDVAIIGRDIRIDGDPVTVVGVMPAAFDPTLSREQIWRPLALTPAQIAERDNHFLTIYGLLKPGISRERALADLNRAADELRQRYPEENENISAAMRPLGEFLLGAVGTQLWVILGAVSLVLLIACGNVANLLLARAATRRREIAIRAAVGAGRGRIIRQLLSESLVMSALASAAGVVVAAGLIKVLVSAAPAGAFPRLSQTRVDAVVLAFALLAGLAATVMSGLVPALRAARLDLQAVLRSGGRGSGAGHVGDGTRKVLIAMEAGLALTLLIGAGLLLRSAIYLQRFPTGMDLRGVVAARLTLPSGPYAEPERVVQAFEDLVTDVASAPGVTRAGAGSVSPLSGLASSSGLSPEGRPDDRIQLSLRLVTVDYFATVGLRPVRGRLFDALDIAGGPPVMIVSQRLADLTWPGQDPIGRRGTCCESSLDRGGPIWRTVVGVVPDVRSGIVTTDLKPQLYLPLRQAPPTSWDFRQRTMSFVARSDAGAGVVVGAIRAAVHRLDPSLPLYDISTGDDLLAHTLAPARFNTLLLGTLATLGLILALAGIYSVVAYFVTLRSQEVGVRMALGAKTHQILGLMLMQGLRPVAVGLLLGTIGAQFATRFLRATLYGVTPTDPVTFGSVIALFGVVAIVAILVPARRAARIDPSRVLGDS